MTATTLASALTVAESASLPLGRLLTREQALLWLDCTDADLDQAVTDGRLLAVRYADASERYPQIQFSGRRCPPHHVAAARATFAALDPSGMLAACWLASTSDRLDLIWRGAHVSIATVAGWPAVSATAQKGLTDRSANPEAQN